MKASLVEDIPRLCQAMQRSRLVLRRYREERREMVRQFVGRHWSEDGARDKVPLNLLSLYVSVVGRNLIARDPRVLLSCMDRSLRPTVHTLQSWANQEIERLGLGSILARVVTDALFSIGICKVALASPAEAAGQAWGVGAGEPFLDPIDLDDFVVDMRAKDWSQVGYIGHRIRVPLSAVKDSRLYSKDRKDLSASTDPLFNLEGDERIGVLGRGSYGDVDDYEPHVDLWEVYLPRHRQVLTLAEDHLTGATRGVGGPLRVQTWVGPECGPYHVLPFGVVPGNLMPKGPLQDLVDLHEGANLVYRKLIRTIERMKELTAVDGTALEDAARLQKGSDGDVVQVNNLKGIQQIVMSGNTLEHLVAVSTMLKDLFAYAAGNLDMMGGLSPQSKTLGQDRMLEQNASKAIADMQDSTIKFVGQVVKSLCWYWWHDPFKVQQAKFSIPGMPELSVPRMVHPAQRKGRFEDLGIRVDPYSIRHTTPESLDAAMDQMMQNILIPLAPLLQAQGIVVDFNYYLSKKAEYKNMPDLTELATVREPPQDDTGSSDKPGMPVQTERRYVRENMPGRTEQGDDRNLISSALGIDQGGAPKNGQLLGAP